MTIVNNGEVNNQINIPDSSNKNADLLKKAEETIYKMRDRFAQDTPIHDMTGNLIGVHYSPYKDDIEELIKEYEEFKKNYE